MSSPRVAFLGSGALGVPTLEALARRGWVEVVVTQPDRPAGRGRANTPTPVATAAERLGLRVLRTEDANGQEIREACAAARQLAVIAFGQKLSPELLGGRVAVNLHPSDLPRWRGAAPIQRAMMAGEERIVACAIAVAQRMDAGEIYAREAFEVGATETAGELHDRVALACEPMMVRVLEQAAAGALRGEAQDDALATRAAKLSKAEAFVDFSQEARLVRSRIHGLQPWPGCDATVAGHALRLLRVRDVAASGAAGGAASAVAASGGDSKASAAGAIAGGDNTAAACGTILESGLVCCGDGAIELLEVQPVGGRAMSWADFRRGRAIAAGARIASAPRGAAP